MLRTRIWMGAVLIALAAGVLLLDPGPWFPFLLVLLVVVSGSACFELLRLLPEDRRPPGWLCQSSVALLILANWPARVRWESPPFGWGPWQWVLTVFAAVVLAAFLVEMARFREPGGSVNRIALTVLIAAYAGVLPCFLAQLRWPERGESRAAPVALALAFFVPKCCDIGAYFTGRLIGRHRMSPVLSPKKTWEGAAGGIVTAVVAAVGINRLGPALAGGLMTEVGFGITVGIAGMLGDLAESLIKRDCRQKDASQVVPGFGGVLDVVDAVVFAAPVSYCWLR